MDMMNRTATWKEVCVVGGIWLGTMVILAHMPDCHALAEEPPLIGDIKRKPVERQAPAVVLEEPTGGVCEMPEGPSPDLLGVLLEEPATEHERQEVETQVERCLRDVRQVADPWLVLGLYRYEEVLGVPDEARGILGAVWCVEAAMRSQAADGGAIRGDIRDGRAMAHGPVQMWPWMREWCGLTDGGVDDLWASMACYWRRVEDRLGKAKGCAEPWRVAEALTANGPRYQSHGCKAESSHWRELMRWSE
jgi:hypothetical protein